MANPLTLLMPVIPGTNPLSIAEALQKYDKELDEALTSIGTVHYARTLLFDRKSPNLQPTSEPSDAYVLAVITEYDGSFEAYIQDFVSQVGEVFDALLQFVVGGKEVTPVAEHVSQFEAFITKNDASQNPPNDKPLFEAYPQTVQQILACFAAS